MNTGIDTHRCPICGASNDCAVARGEGSCWCFTRSIPDAVLEKIPPGARERACVCKACAFGHHQPSAAMTRMLEILRRRNGLS